MTKKKPLVVVTRRLPELVETRMRELFDSRLNLDDKPMSQAEIVEAMREADVLVPTITDHITAPMIAQAGEQMRLIANFGNGVDHIDVTSALRRGITVTNTPGVNLDGAIILQHFGSEASAEVAPGSGAALPQTLHGGPGRAGGGEELGGLVGVKLYLQRVAVQGAKALVDGLVE